MTNFNNMFEGLTALEKVDASTWDTSSITEMKQMFKGAFHKDTGEERKLIVYDNKGTPDDYSDDVPWDTSKVTNMQGMFREIDNTAPLTIDGIDKLDFSGLTVTTSGSDSSGGMKDMFTGSKLDLASFRDLLFALLTNPPDSGDPHLNAGGSTCDDSSTANNTADSDENCCKRAQHKLFQTNSWTNLRSADITSSSPPAPYDMADFPLNDGAPTPVAYGACTTLP